MDPFSKRNEQNSAAAAIEQFNYNAAAAASSGNFEGNFEVYSNNTLIDNTIQEMYNINVEIANDIINIDTEQNKADKNILMERLKLNDFETRLIKLEATLSRATQNHVLTLQESATLEKIKKIKILNIRAIALMTTMTTDTDITSKKIECIKKIARQLNLLTTRSGGGRRRKSKNVFKNMKNKKRKYSKSRKACMSNKDN
jgi:hypothetical protein